MDVQVISGQDLSEEMISRWREIQLANPELISPFFSPEFTLSVASARHDVHVALLTKDSQVMGIFPFERGLFSFGRPVGGILSDYHGIVAGRGFTWNLPELLRQCELQSWDYNHLPYSQIPFQPYHSSTASSPIMNLSAGYETYVLEQKARGTEQLDQCSRKLRKLEREVGAVRFDVHVADPEILRLLMRWKSRQYLLIGAVDLFKKAWIRQVLEKIHATQSPAFGGVLSVLFAGGEIAAAHFGMRSAQVWHYWFPIYNPQLSKYSAGLLLLLKMAEEASSLGLRMIDLGKGNHRYKLQLMNGAVPLAEGAVQIPSLSSWARSLVRKCESRLRQTKAIYVPVRWGVHSIRSLRRLRRQIN
jgi:CelD/BcsL family acetyltransferase involved in cellulose biosynthesis